MMNVRLSVAVTERLLLFTVFLRPLGWIPTPPPPNTDVLTQETVMENCPPASPEQT